ncbi:MAG: SusC/RagA family TonB-linked outer membrane protein [Balneolaceae bacterium]
MYPLCLQAQQRYSEMQLSGVTLAETQNMFYKADLTKEISVEFSNLQLEQALKQIAEKAGLRLTFRGDVMVDKQISLAETRMSVSDALSLLLEGTGLEYRFSQFGYLLISRTDEETDIPVFQEVVQGQVIDAETNQTLPGVNIVVQDSNIGAVTDADGNYSLSVPSLDETLIVSFIGYQTREIQISGRTRIDISLTSSVVMGDEMVVTAFGVTGERRTISYSTADLEGAEISRAVEPNFVNSLSGRMAGVMVEGSSTGPGGSSRMVIRGNTSLAGDNQPLYVVDGMPINNSRQGDQGIQGRTVHGDRGDGISHINSSDIETMTVLKGGQATALYGSRAANGVVLITTKSGSSDRGIGVDFNSSTMFHTISKYPDWQQEYGHGTGYQRPQTHDESASSGRLSFGEPVDGEMYIGVNGQLRPYSPVSIKQNMNNFYDTGSEFSNTLAISGGNADANYRASLSNMDANALMPNSSYNRKTARVGFNARVSEKLGINSNVQYNIVEGINRPQGGYATYNATWNVFLLSTTMDIRDLSPGYYEDNPGQEMRWNPSSAAPNAYWVTNKYRNEDDEKRLIGNVEITYDLSENFLVRGYLGQDVRHFMGSYIIPTGTAYVPRGEYGSTERDITETTARATLNYENSFLENFNLSAMVGGERDHHVTEVRGLSGQDFIVPDFYAVDNLASTAVSRNYGEQGTNSVFGSAEIDYKRVAYLTFTGRQDWFSVLNPEHNNIFYPSVGTSVIMSDILEMPEHIDFFKLRGSWSQTGSAIVPPYATTESYSYREGGFAGISVQNLGGITTPGLKPLEMTSYEFGFDLELLDRRLAMDVSLYNNTTRKDIVNTEIARSSGYGSTRVNVGEVNNKGIEVMLRGTPVRSTSFNWNVSYNLGYNQSEILQLAEGLDRISIGSQVGGAEVRHVVGQPYGMIYADGYQTNAAGQIVFDRASGLPVTQEIEHGRSVPPYSMGLHNRFEYGNFSLGILLDARFGSVMYSNTHWYAYRMGLPKETLEGRENGLHLSGVDQDGQAFERTIPHDELRVAWYNNGSRYPGLFVHKNDFVKLREVTVTYNLPVNIVQYAHLQSASVSLVGRNLMYLYDPMPHVDPESNNYAGNARGLEGFGLPPTRTVGFNVSLNF